MKTEEDSDTFHPKLISASAESAPSVSISTCALVFVALQLHNKPLVSSGGFIAELVSSVCYRADRDGVGANGC